MVAVTLGTPEPRWEPTAEIHLLERVAHAGWVAGDDDHQFFVAACEVDAAFHDGAVSVNRVRGLLRRIGVEIPPRKYSAMWAIYTGVGKPMLKLPEWEVCSGSASRNDGRPFPLRRWRAPTELASHASSGVPA